jgi:hypothetical protein
MGYSFSGARTAGTLLASGALALSAGCSSVGDASRVDWGPIYCRDTALDGSARIRAAGPLYERQDHPSGMSFEAVRPFWSKVEDPANDRRLDEVLWPVATRRRALGQLYWRLLLAYGVDYDIKTPGSRYRAAIFPFFFWGRDKAGNDYAAFFPFGGELRDFLNYDHVYFVLFPLYARAYDRDNVTTSVLWPIYSTTQGPNTDRFRVFPFYGYSERTGEWRRSFILWPFWTHARYMRPGDAGTAWVLFPLVGRIHRENQSSLLVFPPFFRFSSGQHESGYTSPWPFVQSRDGRATSFYLWPLWGWKRFEDRYREFFLWPIGSLERLERPGTSLRRLNVFPFYARETRTPTGDTPPTAATDSDRLRVWPLWSSERRAEAYELKAPVLWPAWDMAPINRNYAPLWTLYREARQGEASEEELLWGLWRHRRESSGATYSSIFPLIQWHNDPSEAGGSGWSLLKGLIGYEERDGRSRVRLLYFLDL